METCCDPQYYEYNSMEELLKPESQPELRNSSCVTMRDDGGVVVTQQSSIGSFWQNFCITDAQQKEHQKKVGTKENLANHLRQKYRIESQIEDKLIKNQGPITVGILRQFFGSDAQGLKYDNSETQSLIMDRRIDSHNGTKEEGSQLFQNVYVQESQYGSINPPLESSSKTSIISHRETLSKILDNIWNKKLPEHVYLPLAGRAHSVIYSSSLQQAYKRPLTNIFMTTGPLGEELLTKEKLTPSDKDYILKKMESVIKETPIQPLQSTQSSGRSQVGCNIS